MRKIKDRTLNPQDTHASGRRVLRVLQKKAISTAKMRMKVRKRVIRNQRKMQRLAEWMQELIQGQK